QGGSSRQIAATGRRRGRQELSPYYDVRGGLSRRTDSKHGIPSRSCGRLPHLGSGLPCRQRAGNTKSPTRGDNKKRVSRAKIAPGRRSLWLQQSTAWADRRGR